MLWHWTCIISCQEVIDTSPPLVSCETPRELIGLEKWVSSSMSPRGFQIDCEFTDEDEKGMTFELSHFKCVLQEIAIDREFTLVPVKNEKSEEESGHCPMGGCVQTVRNGEATSTWIAIKFALGANLSMTLEAIYDDLVEVYGVEASRMQIYRGKKKALEILEGNHAKSYGKLAQYAVEIRNANPGRLVKLELERIPPNLNLTTFKSLLDEVALGGNNGLYPLDYGVVESEGKDSWSFFLYCAHSIIDGPQRYPWIITTAGQKDKPILIMIENVGCKLIEKLKFTEWKSLVTPVAKKKLDEVVLQARIYKITFSGQSEYQVREGVIFRVVNLQGLMGVLYTQFKMSHRGMKSQGTQYNIHLLKGRRLGVEKVGRGMMSLILELVALEGPILSRCGNSGHFGHNKRTCRGAPTRGYNGGRVQAHLGMGRGRSPSTQLAQNGIFPCVATGSVANRGSEVSVGSRSATKGKGRGKFEIGQSGDEAIITTERVECRMFTPASGACFE
ncbi:hypothetical protein Acr_11g0017560 [Actinidia rufa]|uniref:Uncharacterized protein n=1 Tax=Actinidia rufa TaxID=165716 RepID=A0A7J0FFG7_9ERIC|nr:hypothetical protein Acr_11g0017560 [Actinidia rufa]